MTDPPPERQRLAQAWDQFCQSLRWAGEELLRQAPADGMDDAEGVRYLSRLARSALESAFETAGPEAPRLEPMYARRTSIAQRNPDQIYLGARLDSRFTYLISGRAGRGGSLSFVTRASGADGAEESMTGFLDGDQLSRSEDGSFEISVAAEDRSGNWLPMAAGTDTLMVRELFAEPDDAVASAVAIERTDGAAEPGALDSESVVSGLAQAARMVQTILGRFGSWTQRTAEQPNRLWTMHELLGQGEILRVGGSPAIDYYLGFWALEDDEALVLTVHPPAGERWSFQLMNYWQENLNLPWSSSHLNQATARAAPGGSFPLVVSGRNPGVANWVDTAGHAHGVMLFRWFGPPAERPVPTVEVVALGEIPSEPDGADVAARRRVQIAPGYLAQRVG